MPLVHVPPLCPLAFLLLFRKRKAGGGAEGHSLQGHKGLGVSGKTRFAQPCSGWVGRTYRVGWTGLGHARGQVGQGVAEGGGRVWASLGQGMLGQHLYPDSPCPWLGGERLNPRQGGRLPWFFLGSVSALPAFCCGCLSPSASCPYLSCSRPCFWPHPVPILP